MRSPALFGLVLLGFILLAPTVVANQSGDPNAAKVSGVDFRRIDPADRYQFSRRHLETKFYTTGTGSLTSHNQRIENLRNAQTERLHSEIRSRKFDPNRVTGPRATTPRRDVIDVKAPTPHRRTGQEIDDPRLRLQELREAKQVNRVVNIKFTKPDGECAGLSGARLAKCMYELRPGSK